MEKNARAERVLRAAGELGRAMEPLRFRSPVAVVYNPLRYAMKSHAEYVRRYGQGTKEVVFLGMNPGPFGMAQTGIPFGEVELVRDWLGIEVEVGRPAREHPKRPVHGFACPRREVSGRRLWGLIAGRFATPQRFFRRHFVASYCPLLFLEASGRNRTPDKLPAAERKELFAACDRHLRSLVEIYSARWLVGVGSFAERRARAALAGMPVQIGRILHPSPANPKANRDWEGTVLNELWALGICRLQDRA